MLTLAKSLLILSFWTMLASAQSLTVKWEELTAADFQQAMKRAQNTCVLPFGIIEKHGPHLPLGTDLINVRYVALHGAEQEYAIVFPEYYFGQIFEAKHEPGTMAYSAKLQLELLQETTDEMARNGCKKIVIVNGHGGNVHLLPFFAQAQLATPHDYVVYVFNRPAYPAGRPPMKSTNDQHAGESGRPDFPCLLTRTYAVKDHWQTQGGGVSPPLVSCTRQAASNLSAVPCPLARWNSGGMG